MSAADDTIDSMIFYGDDIGDGMLRSLFVAATTEAEMRRCNEVRRIREERFDRFFRTDGEVPEWRTGGLDQTTNTGEWMSIDRMDEHHIRSIIARNEEHRGFDFWLRRIMALPDGEPPKRRLGGAFVGCETWNDALALVFACELERRARLDFGAQAEAGL